MAFTFPDPQITPEFLGDNGITYAWEDNRWKVKSFKGGTPGREAIFSDTPPTVYPGLQPPGNELKPGDIWYDTSDDLAPHVWDGKTWQPTGNYVKKKGGDEMEGPLTIKSQPDTDSRDTNRVKTLGVYSGTQNSSLQLGTNSTKIYVGTNDTSFNNPIKVPEITDRGNNVKISATLDFGQQSRLIKIAPDIGTTQNIDLFGGNNEGKKTTLQFNVNGATANNAIEFVAGPSNSKETVFRIDSNRNLKARKLSMDGTPITNLADPEKDKDAANKRYVDSADTHLQSEIDQIALGLETLLTQRTHGKWKYVGFSGDNIPRNAGEFALASDDLSAQDNIITINLTDLNGMAIGLSDVEVGDYVEIVDDDDPANYALFSCTKKPEGTGISNIEVALKDKGNNFLVGDTCEIRFFSINEQNLDLTELDDRFVNVAGDKMTGTLETPAIKLSGDKAIQEGSTTRIKFNNKVEIPRVGDNKDGFTVYGRNNTQLLHVFHNPSGTADAVSYYGNQKAGSSNLATVKFVEDAVAAAGGDPSDHKHAGLGPKGADFSYDWNQYHYTTYSGDRLIRKEDFPRNNGDWCAEDYNNNYMGGFGLLENVCRIAVQPPDGKNEWEGGYMGFVAFGSSNYSSKPVAIFQVYELERSSAYFRWYVRLLWKHSSVSKVVDLEGKMMKLNGGAIYLNRGY